MPGPKPKYVIQLTEQQYKDLKHLSLSHMAPWAEVQRARILLFAYDYPDWSNHKIMQVIEPQLLLFRMVPVLRLSDLMLFIEKPEPAGSQKRRLRFYGGIHSPDSSRLGGAFERSGLG